MFTPHPLAGEGGALPLDSIVLHTIQHAPVDDVLLLLPVALLLAASSAGTVADDTVASDTAPPPRPATVAITNGTPEPFTTLWVCDVESCLVDHVLDPAYAAPGATLTFEVDPGLTILAAIDAKGRCASTDWFPLDAGETWGGRWRACRASGRNRTRSGATGCGRPSYSAQNFRFPNTSHASIHCAR